MSKRMPNQHKMALVCILLGYSILGWSAAAAESRPQIGLWYTVWWTKDDQFHHWTNCHLFPVKGSYTAGAPEVIAEHYRQFRDLGIDFLIMDDTNGAGNDGGRINDNIRAWFEFMDQKTHSHMYWQWWRNAS